MKAKLEGRISSLTEHDDNGSRFVQADIKVTGKADGTHPTGRDASATVSLFLKPMMAKGLRWGQFVTVTFDTDQTEAELGVRPDDLR